MWWQMHSHIFPSSNSWTFLTFSSVAQVKISSFCGDMQTAWNKCIHAQSIQYYLNLTTGHHQPVNTTELVTCHAKHKKGSQKSKPSQVTNKHTHTLLYHKTRSTRLSHSPSLFKILFRKTTSCLWFGFFLKTRPSWRTTNSIYAGITCNTVFRFLARRYSYMLITLMWYGI